MLIHFPIAALVGLVGADAALWFSGDPFWARAGLWLAGVGAFGGWIAGLVGMIDLLAVARIREKITAWCHALVAVMLLSLASLNWLLRYRGEISVETVVAGTGSPASSMRAAERYLSIAVSSARGRLSTRTPRESSR